MTGDMGLTPDEVEQLGEVLQYDGAKVDDFLKKFFPQQYAEKQEAALRAGAEPVEDSTQYTIIDEGELFVEIKVCGTKVRLDREPFRRGPGRPRANPWIDQRMVDRFTDPAVRAACYSAAAYKLRKEGVEYTTRVELDLLREVRKALFKGDSGLIALSHITGVASDVMKKFRYQAVPANAKLEVMVLQAILSAVSAPVGKDLERNL